MKPALFYWFAFVILLNTGCTQMTPYYSNGVNPMESLQNREGNSIAFIEFGEQGSYQDPSQLQLAIKVIRDTPRPLVVTYVHGWQNNVKSGDVEKFADFLRRVRDSQVVKAQHFNVIGVYLGWRGQLTTVPVAKELSFFNRKATAERLASNFDCYDAIGSISEAARKFHSADGQYTILLGHSFGGLIAERSVAHAINAAIHTESDPARVLPADLILLLNPASDSVLTRQMIAALYSRHTENSREFIVSLTSTADAATGTAFPLAENVAAVTKGFNKVGVPGPGGQSQSEREFFTMTPGHNALLVNHHTFDLNQTISSGGQSAFDFNLSHHGLADHVFATGNSDGSLKLWQFKSIGNVDVPYWNVSVDPSLIADHGDIWNERVQAMMAAIFKMNIAASSKEQVTGAVSGLRRAPDFKRLPTPATQ